jgi:hypothetical protein
VCVLFGGFASRGQPIHDDTWTWDGAEWARLDVRGPSARGAMGMAYDEERQRTVLFGGSTATSQHGDTWEWDGSRWTEATPTNSPSPRAGMQLVYDSRRRVVLGFGGFDQAARQMLG